MNADQPNWSEIIKAAAGSPLGIIALIIIAFSILAFFFFKNDTERTRISIFVMMFVGAVVLTAAILTTPRIDSAPRPTTPTAAQAGIPDVPQIDSKLDVVQASQPIQTIEATKPPKPSPQPTKQMAVETKKASSKPLPFSCDVAAFDGEFSISSKGGMGKVGWSSKMLTDVIVRCADLSVSKLIQNIIESYPNVVFVHQYAGPDAPNFPIQDSQNKSVAVCNLSANRSEVDFAILPRSWGVPPHVCEESNRRTGSDPLAVVSGHPPTDAPSKDNGASGFQEWYGFIFLKS